MKKKIIICSLLAVVVCACVTSAACFMTDKKKAEAPVGLTIGEVTDSSIQVVESLFADGERYNAELSLDGVNWVEEETDGYIFTGLVPNTEYTVYSRAAGWGNTLPSDSISKKVTTLRSVKTDLPQVDYTQERGKITLMGITEEMEVSLDNGGTYSYLTEHTYSQKGKYEILVRYKQTDRAFASEAVTLSVEYSGFFGGLGTEEKPYLVTDYDELRQMDEDENFYKLLNDITFPAEECLPIKFTGSLDGNGKKLISPKVKNGESGSDDAAIFSGTVSAKNLTVENAVCTSYYAAAQSETTYRSGILASNAKEIINCRVAGTVNINGTNGYYGGIAGYVSHAKIQNCYADVRVNYAGNSASLSKELYVGGIVGYCLDTEGEISNCNAKTSFNMTGSDVSTASAGGIAGSKGNALISGCSAQVDITAYASRLYLGGIAGCADDHEGLAESAIVNCFTSGEIVAQNPAVLNTYGNCNVGGILGGGRGGYSSTCNIVSCVSSADISVDGTKLNVSCGGVLGNGYAYKGASNTGKREMKNCLYTGNLAVNADADGTNRIGAVLGYNSDAYEVENCFIKTQPSADVDLTDATAVEEGVYLTSAWQRENLKLDETVWTVTDGELPKLK